MARILEFPDMLPIYAPMYLCLHIHAYEYALTDSRLYMRLRRFRLSQKLPGYKGFIKF